MKNIKFFVISITFMIGLGQLSFAEGLSFSHNDWDLACDNTRTCRASGYQPEFDGDNKEQTPVSVLLEREAGPGTSVTGQLKLGDYDYNETSPLKDLPTQFTVKMQINEKLIGEMSINKNELTANLTPPQVAALLATLPGSATITFTSGSTTWYLSDKGAAAVLLKMDEYQGRLGTWGALYKKGKQNEKNVLPPLPAPKVIRAAIANPEPGDANIANMKPLRQALFENITTDDCSLWEEKDRDDIELTVSRLSKNQLLVSAECWMAAYNYGTAYWVVNAKPPFSPVLVTSDGTDYQKGAISSAHKGRGLGDCWNYENWDWDGKQFILTRQSSTGLCKFIAGGAWDLPVWVSDVVDGADKPH